MIGCPKAGCENSAGGVCTDHYCPWASVIAPYSQAPCATPLSPAQLVLAGIALNEEILRTVDGKLKFCDEDRARIDKLIEALKV